MAKVIHLRKGKNLNIESFGEQKMNLQIYNPQIAIKTLKAVAVLFLGTNPESYGDVNWNVYMIPQRMSSLSK
jgi:hypothetical protein